jgi:hypothetical protein
LKGLLKMAQQPFNRPSRLEQLYRDEIRKILDRYFKLPTFETLGELSAKLVEFGQISGSSSSADDNKDGETEQHKLEGSSEKRS